MSTETIIEQHVKADAIGDRLIYEALGSPQITPLTKSVKMRSKEYYAELARVMNHEWHREVP